VDPELYAILSLAARYLFLTLMLLILLRAWFMTLRDNRKARRLFEHAERAGMVGWFLVGGKRRDALPIPREGVLGASRRADIRLRGRDIRHAHFSFEARPGGLLIVPRPRAPVQVKGQTGKQIFLRDGETLQLGKTKLVLSLFREEPSIPFDEEHIWGDSVKEKDRKDDELKIFEDELWPDP
jgi:hypothetical protein